MLLPDRRRVDLRVDAPAELLDVIRVPGMTVRTRWIIAGTALIVGGIAAWRLAPLIAPPSPGPAAADARQQAAASAWIEARAKAVVIIREKADLAPEGLIEAANSGLSKHGLSREDGHAALTHAAIGDGSAADITGTPPPRPIIETLPTGVRWAVVCTRHGIRGADR